ncbi:MAG: hypothetical protein EBT51_11320 [Flavobacteriaceae bacterium]|nr:hypothetical protein [Flavobacteriaceae bacterium]
MATKKTTPLGPKAQLMKKSVDQLKRKAKQLKIQGYSTKKKEQLVNSIMMAEARANRKPGMRKKKAATGTVKKVTATVTMAQKKRIKPRGATMVKPKVKMRRPTMAEYNGWTNYETWLVNLYYDQAFYEIAEEHYANVEGDMYDLAQRCAEYVDDIIYEDLPQNLFIQDAVRAFIQKVNYREIAEMVSEDFQ